MTQLTMDDAAAGAAMKEAGQDAVEGNSKAFVTIMRQHAIEISDKSGFVTSDNLRIIASERCLEPHHPNVWGAIFLGPHWTAIGHQRSAWPSNHHRSITVWKYER